MNWRPRLSAWTSTYASATDNDFFRDDYFAAGLTKLLFMLTDPDDNDAAAQVELPPDVWNQLSDAMLEEVLGVPTIRRTAEQLGIVPSR